MSLPPDGCAQWPASYFDNLALADHELGELLRKRSEASGQRDNTWIILSADHSWRRSKSYDGRRRTTGCHEIVDCRDSMTCR